MSEFSFLAKLYLEGRRLRTVQIPTAGLSEESFPGKRRTEHLRHRAWERLLHRCFLSFITKDLFNTLVQNSYIIVSFQNISRLWESLISQKKRKMNCRLCSLPSRHIKIWKSWREASNQGAINVLNSWMEIFHFNSEKKLYCLHCLAWTGCETLWEVSKSYCYFQLLFFFLSNYCLYPFKWNARRKALIFQEDSVNRKAHLHRLIGSLSGICWFMHYMPEQLA